MHKRVQSESLVTFRTGLKRTTYEPSWGLEQRWIQVAGVTFYDCLYQLLMSYPSLEMWQLVVLKMSYRWTKIILLKQPLVLQVHLKSLFSVSSLLLPMNHQ